MDPLAPIKFILLTTRFWLRILGPKWIVGLTALSTLSVLVWGCSESLN